MLLGFWALCLHVPFFSASEACFSFYWAIGRDMPRLLAFVPHDTVAKMPLLALVTPLPLLVAPRLVA